MLVKHRLGTIFDRRIQSAWPCIHGWRLCKQIRSSNNECTKLANRFSRAWNGDKIQLHYSLSTIYTFKSGRQVHSNNSFKASFLCDIFTSAFLRESCESEHATTRMVRSWWKLRVLARNLSTNYTPELPVSTLFIALRIVWINYFRTKVMRITTSHKAEWY